MKIKLQPSPFPKFLELVINSKNNFKNCHQFFKNYKINKKMGENSRK